MTAYELVVYMKGAGKRATTQAWMFARFYLEARSKRGLRSLEQVLGEPKRIKAYDPEAADTFLRGFIGAHNKRVAAGGV